MIRYGKKMDAPGLKQLWKESFGDEDAYIDSFFEMLYQDNHVLLEETDGMLLGASFFLPGRMFMEEGWQEIRYVYALAVYPEYRGKKVATRLLDEAKKRYGVPLVTEPADAGLAYGFYLPYGFKKCFYLDYYNINLSAQPPEMGTGVNLKTEAWQMKPVSATEYFHLREKYFLKPGYVEWPSEHIAFALREHRRQGGDALLVSRGNKEGLLLYTVDGDKLVVTETTLASDEVLMYLSYLSSNRPDLHASNEKLLDTCSRLVIKSKADKVSPCRQLLGMAYGTMADDGYLNLTLD